jgi:hypothetical protein
LNRLLIHLVALCEVSEKTAIPEFATRLLSIFGSRANSGF